MPNAQEWLSSNYPQEERSKITKLDLRSKDLEGELLLEGWPNLERLDCGWNPKLTSIKINNLPKLSFFSARNCQLTNLSVNNCPKIDYFNVKKNSLSDLSFVYFLSPEGLTFLDIGDNNFSQQHLSVFSHLINLEELYFGNGFQGSLEPLKGLTRLKSLGIFTPNIDDGLEYLSANLEKIYCHNLNKEGDTSLKIREEMKSYPTEDSFKFTCYDYQAWRENNAERIEVANIDKVTLLKQIKELQARISLLEKQKINLESLLEKNTFNISVGSLSLYSGDIVAFETENGKYWKVVHPSNKKIFKREMEAAIQATESNYLDGSSYFIVEVVEDNKIWLRKLEESLYAKVYDEKGKESNVYFTNDPDEAALFSINSNRDNNKITLQLVNNKKKYLKLKDKSIVAQEKVDESSVFLLSKKTDYQKKIDGYREVIEDVQVHEEKKQITSGKSSLQELAHKNRGSDSQKYTLSYDKVYTKSTNINWGINLSANAQVNFTAGMPLVIGGGVSLQLGAGISVGITHSYSESETISGLLEVNCPGNSMVVAKAILQEYDLETPITTTIARYLVDKFGNERKYVYKVDGMLRGKYAKVFVEYEKAVPLVEKELETKIEVLPK